MSMLDTFKKLLDKATDRLSNLIRRGEFSTFASDFFGQVSAGDQEQFDEVELWQQYGIASMPPIGSEVLLANLGGYGDNAIAFATTDRANRPTDLVSEEVVTYGKKVSAGQAQVRHKTDGALDLIPATGKTVNIGGATGAEYLIKGDTFKAAMSTFFTAVGSATTPAQIAAAATTALGTMASWSSTKGTVS